MIKRVLIIGGYGNFGRFIACNLAHEENIQLIISGRHIDKAEALVSSLNAYNKPEVAEVDIHLDLPARLKTIKPDIVIHTSGPYQEQGYGVAEACIDCGCHYIDLADARDFVARIGSLDQRARNAGVLVCSGASSLPCLSSALIDEYQSEFAQLEDVSYGIATAQLTNRGLATTYAILSYAGKPFKTLIDGRMKDVYGWGDLTPPKFWKLGTRWLGNCDVPDLELFPKRYPHLKTIRFHAGLELKILHELLWLFSGVVRWKLLPSLQPLAPYLLKISRLFDVFGTDDSGFYMEMRGVGKDGKAKALTFNILAKEGDGLNIPVMPAIIMTRKLVSGDVKHTGAVPCMGFVSLQDYLDALKPLHIEWAIF